MDPRERKAFRPSNTQTWISPQDEVQAIINNFNLIGEIIWNSHFSSKSAIKHTSGPFQHVNQQMHSIKCKS